MSDPTHTLEQRHYTLTLSGPTDSADPLPDLTRAIDEVAVALDEYVMDEDISANIDIEFTAEDALVPNIKVFRNGYTLSVTLEGPISASEILSAIASDLVNMYDEMDVDYTDDLYDFQVYFGIGPAVSTSTEKKKSPKKPKKAKRQEEEEVMESLFSSTDAEPEVDVEEATLELEEVEVEEAVRALDDTLLEAEGFNSEGVGLYRGIVNEVRSDPKLTRAFGLDNTNFGSEDLGAAVLMLTRGLLFNKVKRVHDVLLAYVRTNKARPSDAALRLLAWAVECVNISLEGNKKIENLLYREVRYDPSSMRVIGNATSGRVQGTVVPGYRDLKALVILESQRDLYELVSNETISEQTGTVQEHFIDGFFTCLSEQVKGALLATVEFLNTRRDLLTALEVDRAWSEASRAERGILFVMATTETRLGRFNRAIAAVCADENRDISSQESDVLDNMKTILGL